MRAASQYGYMRMTSQKSTATPTIARQPQRQRGKLRVAALLDAGAAVFAEKGYDAATMTEIAVRANAAIGSLYQFFPSKEALADALLVRYAARVEGTLHRIAESAASQNPASLSNALVDLMLDLASDRAAALGLIDAGGDTADRRTMIRDAMRRQVATILITADGTLPEATANAMAVMILHMLKEVPALAQEERTGRTGLVAEARTAIRLYVSHHLKGVAA
jgi:AcrR family transcriptional regulator